MTIYKVMKISDSRNLGRKKMQIEGYRMTLKLKKRDDMVQVKELIVVEETLKTQALQRQFSVAYRRLFKMIMDVIESNASASDTNIALNEVMRMKQILKDKYEHELSQAEYRSMWKKTDLLEKQLKEKLKIDKMIEQMMRQSIEPEEERGRSR